MRYFVELSYNGTNYRGWQRQKDAPSVQQTIEEALSKLLGAPTEITGAGRTDTGVHAARYVAHFDTAAEIAEGNGDTGDCRNVADFLYHANSILPPDIALQDVRQVPDDAHARFDAKEREYTYHILPFKDPFRTETAWQYTVPLDLETMNRAAAHLLKTQDFTTFAKLHGGNKTNICHITTAEWRLERRQRFNDDMANELVFTIRADRFLRNMVRAIVGTLVDVGRGKITPTEFAAIVDARDLQRASGGAPARGLFLTDIKY
jgi:tRNA pseudouridine38-40 synthase